MSVLPEQEINTAKACPGVDLNRQFLEVVERFCYLGDTVLVFGFL